MPMTKRYVHVNIILDFPIIYKKVSVRCQLECACLHQTVNMIVFFIKIMKIATHKGEHLCKCTRVVPQTKRGKMLLLNVLIVFVSVLYVTLL